ncbi:MULTISPECIES: hypothetical protein [Sphingomonadaceae]|jgi:hypothetical protein|uniref:hypothetical protein n=1 Tax=Sphingomonadales TaxID=204457 RepID=UPI001E629BE0|nr:hypothetical protein [Sphingomonas sp. Leaf21]
MTSQSTYDIDLTEDELMLKYDIKRVPTDRFHYKSFRYSRLDDALRQAMRDQPPA